MNIPAHVVDQAKAADCLRLAMDHVKGIVKKSAKEYCAPCPECGGTDRFIVTAGGFFCRGCGAKGDGIQLVQFLHLADSFPAAVEYLTGYSAPGNGKDKEGSKQEKGSEPAPSPSPPNATVEALAAKTGLPVEYLKDHFLLADSPRGVIIPYYDQDGQPKRTRIRMRMLPDDGERFSWGSDGTKEDEVPYGLPHLDREADHLLIVEGESDVWTCVKEGIPAIGIPGAGAQKYLRPEHIPAGVQGIAIVQESDPAGTLFVQHVKDRLKEIRFKGIVGIIGMSKEAKDPTELRKQKPEAFPSLFALMIKTALKQFTTWEEALDMAKETEWDWENWIPRGYCTMILAEQDLGKSMLALWLTRVYTGVDRFWPDGSCYTGKTGKVLWVETEGGLQFHGKRATHWNIPTSEIVIPFIHEPHRDIDLSDKECQAAIRRTASLPEVVAIFIDSLSGGHTLDENKAEMRSVMQWLAELGRETGKAVIPVHHMKKPGLREGSEPSLNRSRGSSTITQFLRSCIGIDKPDPESEVRRITLVKHNMSRAQKPFGMEIVSSPDGSFVQELRFDKDKAPAKPKKETAVDRAGAFLMEFLKDGGKEVSVIYKEGLAHGFPEATLRRAFQQFKLKSVPHGSDGVSKRWMIPATGIHMSGGTGILFPNSKQGEE